ADNDYIQKTETLMFAGTASEQETFTVQVVGNIFLEDDELFEAILSAVAAQGIGVDSADITIVGSPATGTIQNDDTDLLVVSAGDDDLLDVIATGPNSGTYQLTTDVDGSNGGPNVGPIINFTGVTSVTFNSLAGDDELRITNQGGGIFTPSGGLIFNAGADNDIITLSGGAADLQTYWGGTSDVAGDPNRGAAGEGTIATVENAGPSTQRIRFIDVEGPISDTVTVGSLTVVGTDVANTVSVTTGVAGDQVAIDTFAALDFDNKTALAINTGGTGVTDIVEINHSPSTAALTSLSISGDNLQLDNAASLGTATTLTGATSVAINNTLAGNTNDLTINSPATTLGDAAADAITGIGTLTTDAAGTTTINSDTVGADVVTFNDNVVLGSGTTISGATSVTFNGTIVGGGNDLTVNSPATTFGDAATDTITGVANLTTDAGGTATINTNTVTTTGNQTYGDALTITTNVTLTGADVSLAAVDGANALVVNASGTTTVGGAIGATTALTSFTTDATGTTQLSADITTVNGQTLNDAVTMTGDTILTSTNGPVSFGSTINGGSALTIANANGSTSFAGAIGGTTPLTTLSVTSGGPFALGNDSTTTADTTLTVDGTVSLTGGAITAGGSLSITGAGSIVVTSSLQHSGTGTITGSANPDAINLNSAGLLSNFTIDGAGGLDSLVLNDSADTTADSVVVTTTQITGLLDSGGTLNHSSIESLTITAGSGNDTIDLDAAPGGGLLTIFVFGGAGDDTFEVSTSQTTIVTTHGGSPVVPATPGDKLIVTLSNAAVPIVFPATTDGTFSSGSGALTNQDIVWTSIETFEFDGQLFTAGDLYVKGRPEPDRFIFSNGGGNRVVTRINNVFYGPFAVTGTIVAYGEASADRMTISGNLALPVEFHGGEGRDYLAGGTRDDSLFGDNGNDTILTGEGSNYAHGGNGNDILSGRSGSDTLVGGNGNDRLIGSSGADVLIGDGLSTPLPGDDTFAPAVGNDQLVGGNGADLLVGGPGNDILVGGAGNDVIMGNDGDDFIRGSDGEDLIIGGIGADQLHGERNADRIAGGFADNEYSEADLLLLLADWTAAGISSTFNDLGTITTDGEIDSLIGGGGADLLHVGGEDNVLRDANDTEV
ncbi:MAG: Ca2+-binding RTX toxin-like protein, partial [Pirellulaceae bacterium]